MNITYPRLLTSVDGPSRWSLIAVRFGREGMRLSAEAATWIESMAHPAWRHLKEFRSWIGAKAVLALRNLRRGINLAAVGLGTWLASSASLAGEHAGQVSNRVAGATKNWFRSRLPLVLETTRRANRQLTGGLKNVVEIKLPSALESTARTGKQLSAGLKSWSDSKLALAGEHLSQTGKQLSTQLKKSIETKPAQASGRRASAHPSSALKNWFGPRRCSRLAKPPVVAYCWTADTPQSLKIADISSSGLHLLTDVRWPRGATVSMTLQRTDLGKHAPESWLVIDFMVIRWCKDGLAGTFFPPTPYSVARGAENCADSRTLKRFVKRLAVPAHR